jgi:hypothetical protein
MSLLAMVSKLSFAPKACANVAYQATAAVQSCASPVSEGSVSLLPTIVQNNSPNHNGR